MIKAAGINIDTLSWPFLFAVALPFNAMKDAIVIIVTILLYKRMRKARRTVQWEWWCLSIHSCSASFNAWYFCSEFFPALASTFALVLDTVSALPVVRNFRLWHFYFFFFASDFALSEKESNYSAFPGFCFRQKSILFVLFFLYCIWKWRVLRCAWRVLSVFAVRLRRSNKFCGCFAAVLWQFCGCFAAVFENISEFATKKSALNRSWMSLRQSCGGTRMFHWFMPLFCRFFRQW